MRADAIRLAQNFIGDRTGLDLKKRAVLGQHRETSEVIVPVVTIQCNVLMRH